jgi:hypothetical protein
MKQYKNTVQTIQNTVNASTVITKTPTHYSDSQHKLSFMYFISAKCFDLTVGRYQALKIVKI